MKKLVPIFLIVICLVLLIGCFTVPIFEQLDRSDVKGKDVRKLAGDASSKAPLHTGRTMRAQVVALLGPPTYASTDGRSIGYTSRTIKGYWVMPLCFSIEPSTYGLYILRLNFDEQDVLKSWVIGKGSDDVPLMGDLSPERVTHGALFDALAQVNTSGPELHEVRQGSVYLPPTTQP